MNASRRRETNLHGAGFSVHVTRSQETGMNLVKSLSFAAIALAGVLSLASCISSNSPPRETIIVPQGSTAVCSDGARPPC